MATGKDDGALPSTSEKKSLSEKQINFKAVKYIWDAGVKLRMESVPLATACMIYHKFFKKCDLEQYDPYTIAASAMYLASKVCEEQVRLKDIVKVCYRTLHKDEPPSELSNTYIELRESIARGELLILRVLKFQVAFTMPHNYLQLYMKSMREWLDPQVWKKKPIWNTAWAFLRDSYHSDICLQTKAQHMAVAVLYFALQFHNVRVPQNETTKDKWWQVFCEDVNEDDICSIKEHLIKVYNS
ncbi:cyclin-Q-like [Ptychodera flava]|uniref:cyclin-Q-like n=1 Tax=Ptychodera flava TaxID=63121 RepID=UPI00396A7134